MDSQASCRVISLEEDIIWAMKQRHECMRRINSDIVLPSIKPPSHASLVKYQKESITQTMASMLSNQVILNLQNYTPQQLHGCLLSGKISGSMELLDFYEKKGKSCAHQMTKTLDRFVGSILQEIMAFEGDILAVTPDSFLALWKSSSIASLKYQVHSAINCALVLQKKFSKFTLNDIYPLDFAVKLTLTAGSLTFSVLSNPVENFSYVYFGQPLDELEVAEQKTSSGDIIVALSAWKQVNASEFSSVQLPGSDYHKILGVGLQWTYAGKEVLMNRDSIYENADKPNLSEESLVQDSEFTLLLRTEDFSLRPIVTNLVNRRDDLAKFLIQPVLGVLNNDEPLASLEEMRQVVVMHLNVKMDKIRLEVVNQYYKIVCNKAKEFKGLVEKCSACRGTVSFVVMFGMRGFTTVDESQDALLCAVRCHHDLDLFDEAQAVSIGCSTGKCYCAVLGHVLRKDYVVYGRCLYKSRQMASAYPGRVTCDRSTFIYSNLQSENFTLLPRGKRKTDIGPIYEYKEDKEVSISNIDLHVLPLLGRDDEIQTFLKFFEVYLRNFGIKPCCNLARCSFKNCLIFDGVYRQGKSRLLQELPSRVPEGDVQMIKFYENDTMSGYHGVRQMLRMTLGFGNYTAEYFRRRKIREKMDADATENTLYVLNDVFDVNFEAPTKKKPFKKQMSQLREESIKILCNKCFERPTLLLMDNADLMDEESWNLLLPMLETKRFFVVATMDRTRKDLGNLEVVLESLESHHVEKIFLRRIPQVYIAGLICQMLKVYAVPADLEKVIQSNSRGNPGWIENFLLILQQTRKITISRADFKTIREKSLVTPPLYMLKRLSPDSVRYYKSLLEERTTYPSEVIDPWEVYIDSCRDVFRDVDVRSGMQEIFCRETTVPVCLLAAGFDPKADVDPNVTDDLDFLQLYDRLTYQEQLMLRCASVLGDPFTRRLLFFIWMPDHERDAAEVVQNLFEKGVICCARGDFSTGGDYILIRDKSDPNEQRFVDCHCVGLDMHDSCLFMPKYASCGFMRFKSGHFASTTYDLIPEEDRKELHSRAAKFIQKETRRCVSCGCGYFPVQFGCKMDSSALGRVQIEDDRKKKSVQLEHMDFNELYDYSTHSPGRMTISRSLEKGSRPTLSLNFRNTKSFTMSSNSEDRFIDLTYEDKHGKTLNYVNPLTLLKLRKRASLVRTFSKSDFLSCDCHLILNHMYKRLKHHYRGSEQWHQMIVTCIHYVRISMANKNFASALGTIKEALDMLENESHILQDPQWKIKMLIAKFYCLKGDVLLELDQVDEAQKIFIKAMKSFGLSFPDTEGTLRFNLKLLQQKWKQKLRLYFVPGTFLNDENDISQLYISNSIAETLTHLCRIYMAKGQWRFAELAAVMSLKNSLQTETNLIRICEAFSNMMLVAQHFNNRLLWMSLEVHALRYCHKKRNFVEAPELRAISLLYTTIFEARMSRAEFEAALHVGYIAVSIATKCNETSITIRLFTMISAILFDKMILNDATIILRELEFFADELDNNSGRTWYLALAVSFHLETGYILCPFSTVELFYHSEGCKVGDKYLEAKMRLIVTMWVWYLRNHQWENASMLEKELRKYGRRKIDSNNHAITFLYLLEGTLLSLVYRINRRSITGMADERREVERLLKKLRQEARSRLCIKAKLYLLKAYYSYILENVDDTKKFLRKSRKLCAIHENNMVLLLLEHSEKAWNNELSTATRDFWRNHCQADTYISYHEIQFDNLKIYCFTYPKPLFRI
ncbi:adenylate cyclase type 10-like [Coccinella septempunctata]|uniref:adenylate cyclase type 10-like n=1 Tax=Coccinella septempunctata TaxID=41139 RepID=UPI001D05FC8C|nr:adenylate cyclase type 10-like [Coccinella septempunctata]